MPTVTAIKPQKKAGRFNVYLDGKFAFGLDEVSLASEKLQVGEEITAERTQELTRLNESSKLVDASLRFITFRPRSESEVRFHLRGKHKDISASLIDEAIQKLKELGYLDESAFVMWWIEQRVRFKPRGKMFLRSELFSKGVDRDLIEEVLANYSAEDELTWAKNLVAKKAAEYRRLDPQTHRQKLSAHLARQGFSWEVIRQVS